MGRPSRLEYLSYSRSSFFQTALRSCVLFSLFLSKLLHELRRFQTAAGHCCVYNIDVSFGCIVTSFACGWGGGPFWNDILQNEWQAKVQKEERGAFLSLAHVFIFLMKCSSSMSDYYQDESLKFKNSRHFHIFKIAITKWFGMNEKEWRKYVVVKQTIKKYDEMASIQWLFILSKVLMFFWVKLCWNWLRVPLQKQLVANQLFSSENYRHHLR